MTLCVSVCFFFALHWYRILCFIPPPIPLILSICSIFRLYAITNSPWLCWCSHETIACNHKLVNEPACAGTLKWNSTAQPYTTSNGTHSLFERVKMWMCLKCVDALRLDIFMSYQSMFVAIILFSFLMSKQKHVENVECRIWRARGAICMCLYLGFYFGTQNLMVAIECVRARDREMHARRMLATWNVDSIVLLNVVCSNICHNKLNLHMDLDFFLLGIWCTRLHIHLNGFFASSLSSICWILLFGLGDCGCWNFIGSILFGQTVLKAIKYIQLISLTFRFFFVPCSA